MKDGRVVGEGLNRAIIDHDPTSHGEVEAVRDACRRLETVDLSDCDLYTSCEPCALCVAAMAIAGIRTLYYGASLADSAATLASIPNAIPRKIDAMTLRREAGLAPEDRRMPAQQLGRAEAVAAIAAWANTQR